MALVVCGVTIPTDSGTVYANGQEMDKVYANGVLVWQKQPWDGTLAFLDASFTDNGDHGIRKMALYFYASGYVEAYYGGTTYVTGIGNWSGQFANMNNTEIRFVVISSSGRTSNPSSAWQPLTSQKEISASSGGKLTVRVELRQVDNPDSVISVVTMLTA